MQNLVTIKNDFLEIQPLLALQSPWRHDLGRTTMYASTSQAVDNKDRTQGSQTPLELHELQTYSKQISLIDNNQIIIMFIEEDMQASLILDNLGVFHLKKCSTWLIYEHENHPHVVHHILPN